MEQLTAILGPELTSNFEFESSASVRLNPAQKLSVTQALIRQLALPPQLDVLLNHCRYFVDIIGIELDSVQGRFTSGASDTSLFCQRYRIDHQTQVRYFSTTPLNSSELTLLDDLHQCAEQPLQLALEHLHVKRQSYLDSLTQLGNRSHYQESIQRLVNLAQHEGRVFGILMMDLDHFKRANDQYGHQLGDEILIAVADVIKASVRESDYAFRFGGDEFCCLLTSGCDELNQQVAIRIINQVSQHPLLAQHNISLSIGSAVFELNDDASSVFVRADNALYAAKRSGRNCLKTA